MKAVDPRVPVHLLPAGSKAVVVAEHQAEYQSLPCVRTPDHQVVTRWELTDEERLRILNGQDLFLTILTMGSVQPVRLSVGFDEWRSDEV